MLGRKQGPKEYEKMEGKQSGSGTQQTQQWEAGYVCACIHLALPLSRAILESQVTSISLSTKSRAQLPHLVSQNGCHKILALKFTHFPCSGLCRLLSYYPHQKENQPNKDRWKLRFNRSFFSVLSLCSKPVKQLYISIIVFILFHIFHEGITNFFIL